MKQKKNLTSKKIIGTVVSNAMTKTLVVEGVRLVAHPLYKKRRKVVKHYKAHYDEGEYAIGDRVTIEETRPISKGKRWKVIAR